MSLLLFFLMVHYDVMIDNEGHYVQMSIEDIVATGSETVRIRSSRGKDLVVRVETLVEVHRHETQLRRNKQFKHERRERREDPDFRESPEELKRRIERDYRKLTRDEKPHPLPKIVHHDEVPPPEQILKEALETMPRRRYSSDDEVVTIDVDPPSETK